MVAPTSEKQFLKLVRAAGMAVEKSGKEWKIIDGKGQYVMSFAISHRKRGKREVKPCYVRQFQRILRELR